MKGIVFNLLEQVIVRHFSEDVWDGLLDRHGLAGAYTSVGSYPDCEFQALVRSASEALGLSVNESVRWFGRRATPILAERYSQFFNAHKDARSFVLSVNSIIHPEVRKIYPDAHCPDFDFEDREDGSLLMGYSSRRKLCELAHGFILGAADHYGQSVDLTHESCMHMGDPTCRMNIVFHAAPPH